MISSKTITLSTLWSEIKSSTHKPFPGSAAISRIDAESLILDTKTQNSILIYFFVAALTFTAIPFSIFALRISVRKLLEAFLSGVPSLERQISSGTLILAALLIIYMALFFSFIQY